MKQGLEICLSGHGMSFKDAVNFKYKTDFCGGTGPVRCIWTDYGDLNVKLHEHLYFSMNGIDYYPDTDGLIMKQVLKRATTSSY